jgi:hypothetical protein
VGEALLCLKQPEVGGQAGVLSKCSFLSEEGAITLSLELGQEPALPPSPPPAVDSSWAHKSRKAVAWEGKVVLLAATLPAVHSMI